MVKEITITLIATIFSGAYLFAQPAGNQGEVSAPHSDRSGMMLEVLASYLSLILWQSQLPTPEIRLQSI